MITIRSAKVEDAKNLLEIYEPYVKNTAITFEYEVPSLEEFENRIKNTLENYPYLVLENEGEVLGYCYAGIFKGRAAYNFSVETSIYVRQCFRQMGYGRALYNALEADLKQRGFLNAYACIASPKPNSTHLDDCSQKFHAKMGYRLVGTFYDCAYKFDEWYNMVWMEKMLGPHL